MTIAPDYVLNITEEDGLLFGCELDGQGSAKLIDWAAIEAWKEGDPPQWIHLDRNSMHAQEWIRTQSGLTQPTSGALLAEETRPRVFPGKRGIVTILRGVNTNPESNPEDLVAMRMWSDGTRVITLRHRKLMTPRDILQQLIVDEVGPKTAPELYERLIARITERMAATISSFEDRLDEIETGLEISHASETRRALTQVRRDAVLLRRYMSPQREALNYLLQEPPNWLKEHSMHLRETADRLMRYVEEIDSARERSMVLKDDIANQMAESTNKTLYLLAIVSAIFLPLAFLTGLLGINIGGMPGVENPNAFWIFCVVMIILLVLELVLFRRLRWM